MPRLVQPYKNTSSHRSRAISTEAIFSSGMNYTNMPLDDGFCKTLVNYKIHNDGSSLMPRGGQTPIRMSKLSADYLPEGTPFVYFAGTILVSESDDSAESPYDVAIVGNLVAGTLSTASCKLIVYEATPDVDLVSNTEDTYALTLTVPLDEMHGVTIQDINSRKSCCTVLNGHLYSVTSTAALVRHVIKFTSAAHTAITWELEEVEARTPEPTMTVNYGYNMLKSNPYSFNSTETALGDLIAQGVVPYDDDGNVLLSARPGQNIHFKLIYKYPAKDITNDESYRIQVELQDNDAGTSPEPVLYWYDSDYYTPGDVIEFECAPTVGNFSLICRLYKQSSIVDQLEEWDSNTNLQTVCKRNDFVTPHCVTTLASYNLLSDTNTTNKNLNPVTYNLSTATGITNWKQRVVMWGVDKCKNTMWLSDINDPTYFPYPNNVEVFDEDIITCVNYMSDILVFTKTAIWRCILNEDGLTFTVNKVQDKLNLTYSDIATVQSVQNMVFFKSDNTYYMVVPNYSYNTGTYGIQLAPISRCMEQLFDRFEDNIFNIVNTVLGFTPNVKRNPITQYLYNYNNYVDGNEIHNVYKFKYTETVNTVAHTLLWLDVHIVYDTVLRAWYIEMMETDTCAAVPFILTTTGDTVYIKPVVVKPDLSTVNLDTGTFVQYYQYSKYTSKDTLILPTTRVFNNRQYLDTGNRNFSEDLKKRFREVQFCVNILDQGELKFNTGFKVDDIEEVRPYKWVIEPDEDGYISVVREYEESEDTPGITALNFWELNEDIFPDITMHKIRYHICGKGYNGSAQIISDNQLRYELRHVSFVYRQMWAR